MKLPMVVKLKRIFALTLIIFLLLGNQIVLGENEAIGNFSFVAASNSISLYLNKDTAQFAVKNNDNGFVWYSSPQNLSNDLEIGNLFKMEMSSAIVIEYEDIEKKEIGKFNTTIESVNNNTFKIKSIKNGFEIVFYSDFYKTTIPFRVFIENNSLKAEVISKYIRIKKDNIKITKIHILPYFGAAIKGKSGYILVPDGSGAIINFDSQKSSDKKYSRPVYGEDYNNHSLFTDLKLPVLSAPVFAISYDNNAILGIISNNAEEAEINATLNHPRTKFSNVNASFNALSSINFSLVENYEMNVYESGSIKADKMSLTYYFLSGNTDYSKVAKKFKEYLLDNKLLPKKNDLRPSLYLDLYASVTQTKSILGLRYDKIIPLTTIIQAKKIAEEFVKKNVDKLIINYNCSNNDEMKYKSAKSVKLAPSLGSIKFMNLKNVSFYPVADNILTFRKPDFLFGTFFDSVKDVTGVSVRQNLIDLGVGNKSEQKPFYLLRPDKVNKNLKSLLRSFESTKRENISFSDISQILYSDYQSKVNKRDELLDNITSSLNDFKKRQANILLKSPNIYAVKYADNIISLPTKSSNHDIFSENVPFIQLVLNNTILYSSEPINLDGNPSEAFLKVIETGSMPNFSFIYEDTSLLNNTSLDFLYSANYSTWIDTAVNNYKVAEEIYEKAGHSELTNHKKVADHVYLTEYENGLAVYVNYSDTDYSIQDKTVKRKSYLLVGGENN